LGCTLGGVRGDRDGDRMRSRALGTGGELHDGIGATCRGEVSAVMRGALVALAASSNTLRRSPSAWRVEVCSCGDLMPWRVSVRHAVAAITWSSGVTDGLVRYLCLKKAAPEMRMAHIVGVQNSNIDSGWWTCPGQMLLCSVWRRCNACGVCRGPMLPCRWGQRDAN
jgi:hypothetical protein